MRERAIKFLAGKLKTLPEDVMTKEVEEYVFAEAKKVVKLWQMALQGQESTLVKAVTVLRCWRT